MQGERNARVGIGLVQVQADSWHRVTAEHFILSQEILQVGGKQLCDPFRTHLTPSQADVLKYSSPLSKPARFLHLHNAYMTMEQSLVRPHILLGAQPHRSHLAPWGTEVTP